MRTGRAGVSLIELIVVLLILSLVIGVAIPALTAAPAPHGPAGAVDSARVLAVQRGRPVAFPASDTTAAVLALPDGRVLRPDTIDVR